MCVWCKTCNNKLYYDDAELVREIPKDILDAFVFEPNLDENWDLLICSVCYQRLLDVFAFKATCTRADNAIVPYIDWENPSGLDLRDIYLVQEENQHVVMLAEDEKICRLCMELAGNEFVQLQEIDLEGLQWLLPDIHLNVIKDPVVCLSCLDSFTIHSDFYKRFLDILGNNYGQVEIDLDSLTPSLESFGETEGSDIMFYDELDLNKKEIDGSGHTCNEGEDIKKERENTSDPEF